MTFFNSDYACAMWPSFFMRSSSRFCSSGWWSFVIWCERIYSCIVLHLKGFKTFPSCFFLTRQIFKNRIAKFWGCYIFLTVFKKQRISEPNLRFPRYRRTAGNFWQGRCIDIVRPNVFSLMETRIQAFTSRRKFQTQK